MPFHAPRQWATSVYNSEIQAMCKKPEDVTGDLNNKIQPTPCSRSFEIMSRCKTYSLLAGLSIYGLYYQKGHSFSTLCHMEDSLEEAATASVVAALVQSL